MNKIVKVKITKATHPQSWYINEIGEEYDVIDYSRDDYVLQEDMKEVKNGNYNIPVRSILKQDSIKLWV